MNNQYQVRFLRKHINFLSKFFGTSQCQLIRLFLDNSLDVFPEISGGKHRFAVRFFRQPDTAGRPAQARELISFELQCCGV